MLSLHQMCAVIESCIHGRYEDEELLYVAGPMRGYEFWNFPAFDIARDRLVKPGRSVISPADMDRARGITEHTTSFSEVDFYQSMRIDLLAITQYCTGIYFLKGWEKSRGSKIEWVAANATGLTMDYEEGAKNPVRSEAQPDLSPVTVVA